MIRGQNLIAGLERKRTKDPVDAFGRVANERQVVGRPAQEPCEPGPRAVEEVLQLTDHKPDRVALESIEYLPLSLPTGVGQDPKDPWFRKRRSSRIVNI